MVVVEVVDVVDFVFVVVQFYQFVDIGDDVGMMQCVLGVWCIKVQMYVYFDLVNGGQVIMFVVEKQVVEQC